MGKEVEENTVQVKQEEEEEEVDRRQPAPLIKVTQTLQASEIVRAPSPFIDVKGKQNRL